MTAISGIVTTDSGRKAKIGHDQTESPVTFTRHGRSRSNGIGGHVGPEYAGGAHSEKIELGRQFAELLEDTRSASLEKIEAALAPFCFEIHSNTVKGDKEIANLAFLVDREKLPEFERGAEKIADEFDDRFTFQYSGPWAPYNFVSMELDL
ncbi:GvpL/GvpF family gas vesicle protein [Methylococcus sp. ANG]|uniref:GvpL/GvpF family gas vesicle protein n=1 Tax=Methylococcus sp. ANG TaxID=3231903 RepID=UPI003457F91B